MKTVVSGIAATALTAGTIAAGALAYADDERQVRRGDCRRKAEYRMLLKDADRDDRDRLRAGFRINGPRENAVWRVTIKRSGDVVHRDKKRANDYGNVRFADRFRGDDDTRVKVIARSGYGERCDRAMRLDD